MTTDTVTRSPRARRSTQAVKCPCAVWPDVAPSSVTDASDTSRGEPGCSVPGHAERENQRDPVLQGAGQHRHSHRYPGTAGRHRAGTGTFSNESTQGWEELDFSTPVAVTAGTTYVASYLTTTGHYADTSGGLSSAVTNGPLTALATAGSTRTARRPRSRPAATTGRATGVDVVYQQNTSPPSVTATTPGTSATSVPVGTAVTVTLNEAIESGSATFSPPAPGGVR